MSRKVADVLWEMMESAGVKRCYGIVGDALNPVIDALRRNGKIEFIHVRHEEYGVFAAVAEAYLTGNPVAVCGTAGPGTVHLFNGLMDARKEGAAVIAIAGDVETHLIDTSALEELNPYKFFDAAALYIGRLVNPEQARPIINTAILTAIIEKGPTVISIPGDIASADAPSGSYEMTIPSSSQNRPSDSDLTTLVTMIDDAKKVAIFGGEGCRDARDEVLQLATKLNAPVGYSFRGKQWLEHDNPNAVGMTGLLGYGGAYNAIHDADLLLLLGTDFPFSEFLPGKSVKKSRSTRTPNTSAAGQPSIWELWATSKRLSACCFHESAKSLMADFSRSAWRRLSHSTSLCSITSKRGPASSPYVRNFSLRHSANSPRMTRCFSLTPARHASGRQGISPAARIAGFSARLHGRRWRMPRPMHSARNSRTPGGKRSRYAGTAGSPCSRWATS